MGPLVDSVVLLALGLVVFGGLLKLGGFLGGKRAPWLAFVLPLLGAIGAVLGFEALLDRAGAATRGGVVGKTEWVTLNPNGSWFQTYSITVRHRGAPSTETVNHRVDRALFDSLAVGDSVAVRAASFRPSISRIESMTLARWVGIARDTGMLFFVGGVLAVLAGLFLFGGTGVTGSARKAAALALVAAGGFACWPEAKPYRGPEPPAAPAGTAEGVVARVRSIYGIYPTRLSSTSRGGWRLPQPYQVVEVKFTPAGGRTPVTGVDVIDEGSVPGVATGKAVALSYDRGDPRVIQLRGAARRWPEANARSIWVALGWIGGLVAGFVLLRLGLRVIFGGGKRSKRK